jgi:hypothetical protein
LQKASFVNWAVEKALEANVPEEVGAVFVCKEVLVEASREVGQLLLEHIHSVSFFVVFNLICEVAVGKLDEGIILLKQLVKDVRVVFCELTVLELCVGDGFAVILTGLDYVLA